MKSGLIILNHPVHGTCIKRLTLNEFNLLQYEPDSELAIEGDQYRIIEKYTLAVGITVTDCIFYFIIKIKKNDT